MAAAIGRFVNAHSCDAFFRAYSARVDGYVGQIIVAEIGFEETAIVRLWFDSYNLSGWTGEFAEEAGKIADVSADVEEIAAQRICISFQKIFCQAGLVFAAAVKAATDTVALVALHAQAERQMARGDSAAEGIGALGPVGQATDFVTQAVIHGEIITFEICGEERPENDLKMMAQRR